MLVTVVVPTFDRLPLLQQAIASVQAQTHVAWELVVVDDGSQDGTREHLAALEDSRIRAIHLAHCGHLGRLRNTGARWGRGEYLAFLDSDDLWLPSKVEAQLAQMRREASAWSHTDYDLVDVSGRKVPRRAEAEPAPQTGWTVRDILLDRADISNSTLMVERATFFRLGGYSESPRLELRGDRELQLRLAYDSQPARVPEVLTLARDHAGRITASVADPHERSARIYDAFLAWCRDPELRRLAQRRRGKLLRTAALRRLRAGEVWEAVRLAARGIS